VVVDFAGKLGQNIYLMDRVTGTQLLRFRLTQDVVDDGTIPATLPPLPDIGEPTVTRIPLTSASATLSAGLGRAIFTASPVASPAPPMDNFVHPII
jgi:hypothetical protein